MKFLSVILFILSVSIIGLHCHGNDTTRNRRPRIAGGDPVVSGEYPYQVSIQSQDYPICGGAIISKWHVLSAAHCFVTRPYNYFYDPKTRGPLKIVAGTHDLSQTRNSVIAEVGEIIVSNYYRNDDARFYIYDFSILKLKRKLDLDNNPKVKKINLPRFNAHISYAGQYAIATGFGITNTPGTNNFYQPSNMRKVEVQVWDNTDCNRLFNGNLTIDESHVCVYAPRNNNNLHGTCLGDSGSPLEYNYTVIGVLSSSPIQCGAVNQPSVYLKIASYVPFIRKIMSGNYDNEMSVARL